MISNYQCEDEDAKEVDYKPQVFIINHLYKFNSSIKQMIIVEEVETQSINNPRRDTIRQETDSKDHHTQRKPSVAKKTHNLRLSRSEIKHSW